VIVLGGPMHGSDVEVPEGAVSWLDIRRAQTYYVEWVNATFTNPITGRAAKHLRAQVLVWEQVLDLESAPVRAATINGLLVNAALRAWFARHSDGVNYPIPPGQGGPSDGRKPSP
jgi:hypothetical protein